MLKFLKRDGSVGSLEALLLGMLPQKISWQAFAPSAGTQGYFGVSGQAGAGAARDTGML